MATYTPNHNLKKPAPEDFYNVTDQNGNMDKIDAALASMVPKTQKGAAGGLAELGSDGKVPAAQLPSYVDDVLEYATLSAFPATGEAGKIYVALDSNKTYRWGGSTYVEVSQGVELGETASTAYRGDRGKTAYDHSQTSGNPHATTAAQVGAPTVLELREAEEKCLIRDLNIMLNLSLGTPNIDAWADLLGDASQINSLTNAVVSGGVLQANQTSIASHTNTPLSNEFNFGFIGSYQKAAQTFTANASISNGTVFVTTKILKKGSPTSAIVCKIYSTTGSNSLPYTLLYTAGNAIAPSSVSTTYNDFTFTFDNINLVAGNKYAIVFETGDNTTSSTNYYCVPNSVNTDLYTGGTLYGYDGTSWTLPSSGNTTFDMYFIVIQKSQGTAIWKPKVCTEAFYKASIAYQLEGSDSSIEFYVSCDGTNWIKLISQNTGQVVNFTKTSIYLKAIINGNTKLSAVAWGGY